MTQICEAMSIKARKIKKRIAAFRHLWWRRLRTKPRLLDDVDVGADADADDDVFLLEFNDRDDREETSELERQSNRTKELQKEKS